MTRAADVAELVLGEIRASDGVAFSGARYRDEPILYTGAQMPGRVPARIKEMRALAQKVGWHSFAYGGARLFYEQAHFMADFEDDCPYTGQFERYFPTYEDMPDRVLRGYFTWRARYRAGRAEDAPLSFLFVHAYELLCGAGVEPGMPGYRKLGELRATYGERFRALDVHLSNWQRDYALYHGLDPALALPPRKPGAGMPFAQAVCLLRQAEEAATLPGTSAMPATLSDDELFEALSAAGRYHVGKSAALRSHRDELVESCCAAFALLVSHCARRRKKGFVEGAFGQPVQRVHKMYNSAVFHDPQVHADARLDLGHGEAIICRNGMWHRQLPYTTGEASAELGSLMHAVDAALRQAVGDVSPLKPREAPAFLRKMAKEAVDGTLARRAAEEAARVRIDRAALAGIRVAAAATRESLLVDEERAEAVEPAGFAKAAPADAGFPPAGGELAGGVCLQAPNGSQVPWITAPAEAECSGAVGPSSSWKEAAAPAQNGPAPVDIPPASCAGAGADVGAQTAPLGLSPYGAQLLAALLADAPVPPAPAATTLAMEADAVNEALFELVGDVCIEFGGEEPRIVEDYREDVLEALA